MVIAGIDPGFSNLGLAAFEFCLSKGLSPLELVYVGTKKSTKKRGIREKSDEMRRLGEIRDAFIEFTNRWRPDVYAFEECPNVRNASSSRKIGTAWGGCYCLATQEPGVIALEYSPTHLKTVVTGDKKASKELMQKTLLKRFPDLPLPDVAKTKIEHPIDAVAACVAASEDPSVVALAQAMRRIKK
jgi:Holliday junction resolvasome RuvABC endonuclease subunit